jgi:hypothetical protein
MTAPIPAASFGDPASARRLERAGPALTPPPGPASERAEMASGLDTPEGYVSPHIIWIRPTG